MPAGFGLGTMTAGINKGDTAHRAGKGGDMARLSFNVPFFRPAGGAVMSELPEDSPGITGVATANANASAGLTPWHESGAGGWHESSHDLRAGASVSEWTSFDEIDHLRALS